MKNVLLQAVTNEEGAIRYDIAKQLFPKSNTDQDAMIQLVYLLANTNLDVEFIEKVFPVLPLEVLLMNSDVPESIIENHMDIVFSKLLNSVVNHESGNMFIELFKKDYSASIYEDIISRFFTYLTHNEVSEEALDVFSNIINAYVTHVSKEFIMNNIHDVGYYLLVVALQRDDITLDDLNEHIDDISLDEINALREQFLANEYEDEEVSPEAKEKHELVCKVMLAKVKTLVNE